MESLNSISILVRNERGVLSRVSSLISRRGFNIISLAVGETENPDFSRITVVIKANEQARQQAVKQLERIVSVIKVEDYTHRPLVARGFALIKVKATSEQRSELSHLASIFKARIEHVDEKRMIIGVFGAREKINAFAKLLEPFGIVEMARTGQIALARKPQEDQTENYLADSNETG